MTQLIIAALVVASLTAWGFFERSGKLSCAKDNATLTAQVNTLSDKIDTQNKAVEALDKASKDASTSAKKALAASEAKDKLLLHERAKLKELQKAGTPKGAGCERGWDRIEEVSGHKPAAQSTLPK